MATSFYRTGTVAVTQNSKVVTGTGTKWTQGANKPLAGDVFIIDQEFHEIERIASDTELHLFTPFIGANKTNANYGIMRNASLNISSRIAASVSVAINQKQKMLTELNVWMTDTVGPTVPLTDVFGVVNQYVPLPLLIKSINDLINDSSNIASIVSEGKQARDQAVSANNAVQQAKTHIDQTKSQIDTIKGQVDQQEQTINTQHGEVSVWHTSAQQSAATATTKAGEAAADAVKTAADRVHIDAAKQSIDHSKASIDTSESHINTTKGQIDTINTGLTAKYNEVLSHASQVASDKNAVATLKGETETARDEAVDAKNVAQAIASPFIRGVDFTPSAAKEYPTMPSSGTVIMFRVVGVPIGTPYHFTTGDLKGKYVDDDDYLVAMRFSANVVAWSIMKLGRTSIASVNGHSERDITLDKTDIGLGNVNNFGATASVSDESIQKYALAKGVHDAYQHADTALSKANQKWTFDQQVIDDRVAVVGAQNFAGKNGSTTEQFSVPKDPSSDNSAASKAYVDRTRSRKNYIQNGGMVLWQRGTTRVGSSLWVADRWALAGAIHAKQLPHSFTTLSDSPFVMEIATSANASLDQGIEFGRADLAGKEFVVSLVLPSSKVAAIAQPQFINLARNTVLRTGSAWIVENQYRNTPGWSRITSKFSATEENADPNNSQHAVLRLNILSTWGTGWLGEVVLNEGSHPDEYVGDEYTILLRKCQRFYFKFGDPDSNTIYTRLANDGQITRTIRFNIHLPTPMFRAPTFTTAVFDTADGPPYNVSASAYSTAFDSILYEISNVMAGSFVDCRGGQIQAEMF